MELKNCMEDIVFDGIKKLLKETKYCSCEKCIYDMAAIALNELPPRYVATEKGVLFAKSEQLDKQNPISIMTVLVKAAEIVSRNPKHHECE